MVARNLDARGRPARFLAIARAICADPDEIIRKLYEV